MSEVKFMTEDEIRIWIMKWKAENNNSVCYQMTYDFARHVGILKEEDPKFRWAWVNIMSEQNGVTKAMTERDFLDNFCMHQKHNFKYWKLGEPEHGAKLTEGDGK